MKLNPISTRLPISSTTLDLRRPNPPTAEAVKKAKFVDKTYHWKIQTHAEFEKGEEVAYNYEQYLNQP